MNPFETKIFEGTTPEEKFQVSVMALANFAKTSTLLVVRLGEIIDRLEEVARRLESKSWEKAINAELDRREKERSSR